MRKLEHRGINILLEGQNKDQVFIELLDPSIGDYNTCCIFLSLPELKNLQFCIGLFLSEYNKETNEQ